MGHPPVPGVLDVGVAAEFTSPYAQSLQGSAKRDSRKFGATNFSGVLGRTVALCTP